MRDMLNRPGFIYLPGIRGSYTARMVSNAVKISVVVDSGAAGEGRE